MHLMHFYYRLHSDCRGRLVDKTKAWGVSRVYCFFNCQACHHTFVLNLCSVCRLGIIYLQSKPMLLQQCGEEI